MSSIVLSNGNINFDEDTTSYNVNVANDASSITVEATPEDTDYKVTIGGTTIDDDDDYAKTVSLSTGSNAIKIIVSDDDDNTKTYTLNVNRLVAQTVGQGTNMVGIPKQAGAGNNNEIANGIDNQVGNGSNNGIANSFIKGWKNDNGTWNYIDSNGNKTKGWQQIDEAWYYLDNDGNMKRGWLKDTNESWYYFHNHQALWLKIQ